MRYNPEMARFSLLLRSRPVPPALRAVECAARRPTLCFAIREDDNNSGGGMIVHEKNLPAEVGKSKDLPARSAADVIAEMAAKIARYPAKPKEEWEGMSAEEMYQRGNEHYDKEEYVEAAIMEAVKWYRCAAEQGHSEAQYKIGWIYNLGRGVSIDQAEAVKWIRRAAEQGHAKAQFFLGVRYSIGRSVPWDYAEAAKWYRRAAEQGHSEAQFYLGKKYAQGKGVPQDYAEAAKWIRRAAEQGAVNAQFSLGMKYAKGEGIPQDYVEAAKWIRRAAEQGYTRAQEALAQISGQVE